MSSRTSVASVAIALLLVSSGCLGFITGSEAKTFEAEWAATGQPAASATGYELNSTRSQPIEREFTVAGQTRTVKVINKITTYQKALDLGPLGERRLGVFAVVSTPAVQLGPETFNPVGDYSNEQLVELLTSQYDGLGDVRKVDERQLTVLGTETTVTKFAGTATFEGAQVDVYVQVTKVRSGDDFVVPVGIYPQALDGEASNVFQLMEALEHPASVSA